MAIEFPCSGCGATLRVPATAAGRMIRCGKCESTLRAPVMSAPLVAPALEPLPAPEPSPVAEPPKEFPFPKQANTPQLAPTTLPQPLPPEPTHEANAASVPEEIPVAEEAPPQPLPASPEPLEPAIGSGSDASVLPQAEEKPKPSTRSARELAPKPRRKEREMGSSPIVRMLVILGVVGVAVAALAGFLVWKQLPASAEWRNFDSARGGYKVEYPAAPLNDIEKRIGFPPTPGATCEGTVHRRVEYAVVWGDFPGGRNPWATDEQIIAASIDGMRGAVPGGQCDLREPSKVGAFNAREVVLSKTGEGTYVAKFVVAETRFFMLIAGGRNATPENPDVRRFLDSFEITDTRFANASKAREQQVEQARIAEEKRQEDLRQRREAELKRQEELRLAEIQARELAEKKHLHDILVADQNEEFLKAVALDGVTAPEPDDFTKSLDEVFTFRLDERKSDGVWLADPAMSGTGSDFIRQATIGPGVRVNAAYLRQGNTPASFGSNEVDKFALKRVFDNPAGYTLSGWVRTRTLGVEVFRGENALGPVVELTLGRATVSANIFAHQNPTVLSFPWAADEKWHHVALVREQKATGGVARLYFDGKMVAVGATNAPPQLPTMLKIGGISSKESEATKVPDFQGKPGAPAIESLVGAIDDCCLIARPLATDEVQSLAGRAPPPASLREVKLTAGKQLGAITGLGFDPHRKAVWVVTGNQPPRFPPFVGGQIQKAPPAPASRLRKLSYPGFEELANYELPGTAIAVAFDQPRNRLFVTLAPQGGQYPASSQDWPATDLGTLQRFDLDTLPPNGKQLVADAEASEKFAVRAMAVSPDGATVYFTGCDTKAVRSRNIGATDAYDNRLYRVGDSLDGDVEQFPGNERLSCASRFELSPDGKTLSIFRPAPRGGGGSELLEVDTERWGIRDGVVSYTFPTDWVSVNESRYFVCTGGGEHALDVHAMPRVKNASSFWGIGATGRQFLGILAGGRLLVTSGADPTSLRRDPQKLNVLRVYDSSGKGAQRSKPWKPFVELPESADVLVGGPFWVAPDGRAIVFRSGQVVNVESGADIAPRPIPPPSANPVVRKPSIARAPLPRERAWETEVTAPAEIPGLKFHLSGEKIDGDRILDEVSGKVAGQLGTFQVIAGPRGKALRLTSERTEGRQPPPGIAITDTSLIRIPAEKPFTLALWVRWDAEFPGNNAAWCLYGTAPGPGTFSRQLLMGKHGPNATITFRDQLKKGTAPIYGGGGGPVDTPTRWHHFAATRNAENDVTFYLDGVPTGKERKFAGAVDYESFTIVSTVDGKFIADVDEFCLFERGLSENEVRGLAGRKPVVGGAMPDPNPIAKKPDDTGTKPKDPRDPPAISSPVAAASDIKGLKLYLPFDDLKDGAVKDTVSSKFVGKLDSGELVEGARGKGLRLTTTAKGNRDVLQSPLLDLTELKEAFQIPADGSFTLAIWVKYVSAEGSGAALAFMGEVSDKGKPTHRLSVRVEKIAKPLARVHVDQIQTRLGALVPSQTPPTEWLHVAIFRDGNKPMRMAVNGVVSSSVMDYAMPLTFDRLGVMVPDRTTLTAEIDELCFFDRTLTADEIGALAGKKALPKQAEPGDVAIAPMPRRLVGRYEGGAVPAATELKGLIWYLPLNDFRPQGFDGGTVVEAVSGKQVGRLGRDAGKVINGPRGHAIQLTAPFAKPGTTAVALDLSGHGDVLRFPAGKPFTVAVWLRSEKIFDAVNGIRDVFSGWPKEGDAGSIGVTLQPGGVFGYLRGKGPNSGSSGQAALPADGEWYHLAVARTPTGRVRVFVNGSAKPLPTGPGLRFTDEIRCDFAHLVSTRRGEFSVGVAEFCVFDRILDDEEVEALAGKRSVPKPKQPEQLQPIPPASDLKGLKVYLPFDEVKDGAVRESITGKFFGKTTGLEQVDGPRGKAVRLTNDLPEKLAGPNPGGLDLADLTPKPEILAGKPFTISVWFREVSRDPKQPFQNSLLVMESNNAKEDWRSFYVNCGRGQLSYWVTDKLPGTPPRAVGARSLAEWDCTAWTHIAIVRDEKNIVSWWLNGKPGPSAAGGAVWDGLLGYDRLSLAVTGKGKTVFDVDEFCLFDRALSEAEIATLAGRKPAVKANDPPPKAGG